MEDDSGESEDVPNPNRLENSADDIFSHDANHESGSGFAECAEYDESCIQGSGGKRNDFAKFNFTTLLLIVLRNVQ